MSQGGGGAEGGEGVEEEEDDEEQATIRVSEVAGCGCVEGCAIYMRLCRGKKKSDAFPPPLGYAASLVYKADVACR